MPPMTQVMLQSHISTLAQIKTDLHRERAYRGRAMDERKYALHLDRIGITTLFSSYPAFVAAIGLIVRLLRHSCLHPSNSRLTSSRCSGALAFFSLFQTRLSVLSLGRPRRA